MVRIVEGVGDDQHQVLGVDVTDEEGAYSISHLVSGIYDMRLEYEGGFQWHPGVEVVGEGITYLDLYLVSVFIPDGDVESIPREFWLSQNYPNPFNPETKIAFSLAEDSRVKLTIYDVAGEEVATLLDTELSAGSHVASWHANSFSSGIYFYRISAGDYVQTRRMILLK